MLSELNVSQFKNMFINIILCNLTKFNSNGFDFTEFCKFKFSPRIVLLSRLFIHTFSPISVEMKRN